MKMNIYQDNNLIKSLWLHFTPYVNQRISFNHNFYYLEEAYDGVIGNDETSIVPIEQFRWFVKQVDLLASINTDFDYKDIDSYLRNNALSDVHLCVLKWITLSKEFNFELIIRNYSKHKTNLKGVGQPLRIALTGSRFGPGIYNIILSLEKDVGSIGNLFAHHLITSSDLEKNLCLSKQNCHSH